MIWEDDNALKAYLERDFEKSLLYLACYNSDAVGIFGALNISGSDANLLVWLDKKIRSNIMMIKFWIYFLLQIKPEGVHRLYAKILKRNNVSLNAALRYGFFVCSDSLTKETESDNRCCVTRDTSLNDFEEKYFKNKMETLLTVNKK